MDDENYPLPLDGAASHRNCGTVNSKHRSGGWATHYSLRGRTPGSYPALPDNLPTNKTQNGVKIIDGPTHRAEQTVVALHDIVARVEE